MLMVCVINDTKPTRTKSAALNICTFVLYIDSYWTNEGGFAFAPSEV